MIIQQLKNTLNNYNEKFLSELSTINNIFENKSENINKKQKNKKDMYYLINIMFNNLGKYLFETNNKINSLSINFFQQFNNIISSYNKYNDFNKEKQEIKNINQENNKNTSESKKDFLKNVNGELTELKNNIKNAINIINEKFVDFSDLINYNNLKDTAKINYEINQVTNFSLINSRFPNEIELKIV